MTAAPREKLHIGRTPQCEEILSSCSGQRTSTTSRNTAFYKSLCDLQRTPVNDCLQERPTRSAIVYSLFSSSRLRQLQSNMTVFPA